MRGPCDQGAAGIEGEDIVEHLRDDVNQETSAGDSLHSLHFGVLVACTCDGRTVNSVKPRRVLASPGKERMIFFHLCYECVS
jgi:hypothetical protein